jgi:DnaJ homolog subfamily C member 2
LPSIGDENTPWDDIEEFYKLWGRFISWRDFSFDAEHDPDRAESRDERRWMEKQNEKVGKEAKKTEKKQITNLLDMAKRFDPRIRAKNEKINAEKKRKEDLIKKEQEKKHLEKYQKNLEASKKKDEDEKRKKQAKEDEIKRKKQEKLLIEQTTNDFKSVCRPHVALKGVQEGIDGVEVQLVVSKLTIEELAKFTAVLSQYSENKEKFIETFNMYVGKIKSQSEIVFDTVTIVEKKVEKTEKEWTVEELANLSKGIKNYPNNSPNRWENIAKLTGRTVEEVQKKTNEMKKNVTDVPKLDQSHHFQKFNDQKTNKIEKGKISEDMMKKAEELDINYEASAQAIWSPQQQKLLEEGLRKFKGLQGEKKWMKISELVKDKSSEACQERFEHCKQLALQKRKK